MRRFPSSFFPSLLLLLVALKWLAQPASAAIEHVLAISLDGMRGDFLQTLIDSAPEEFPNFLRLRQASASTFNARSDYSQTITIPNHLAMMTGRPVSKTGGLDVSFTHGYEGNTPFGFETVHVYDASNGLNSGPYKASIFDMVHDRGLSTAMYLGKERLRICERSWNAENGAPDVTGVDNGRNKFDFVSVVEALDTNGAVTGGFIADLSGKISAGTLKNFTFLHITETDYAGHASGWTTEAGSPYRAAVHQIDGWIGQLLDAFEGNGALAGKYAILVTADHGGGVPFTGHEGVPPYDFPTNYTIPFFLLAPGITPGSDLYEWFENRQNPLGLQFNDLAKDQPIRNGDVANLVATLIGVPYVDGSSKFPELKKPVRVTRLPSGKLTVSWPVYLTGWTLEYCDNLGEEMPVWTSVAGPIETANGACAFTQEATGPRARFFRLRRP